LLGVKGNMTEDDFYSNNRGKWSEKSIPHKGWTCIDIEDLGDSSLTCEMCESQEIRYVHYMQHHDYNGILKVGCICAGHMEEDIVNARKREDFMKSRMAKRIRWLSRNWKYSKKGNEYIKTDGFIVTIKNNNYYWSALVQSEDKKINQWSKREYKTRDEAKLAAFDFITRILIKQGKNL